MSEAQGDSLVMVLRKWGFLPTDPRPCVVCSRGGLHSLHHIDFKSRGGDDSDGNLAPTCLPHHNALHAEQLHLVAHDGLITTVTWPDGDLVSETPWPPKPNLMQQVGAFASTAREALEEIQAKTHHLTAPELVHTLVAVIGVDERSKLLKRQASYQLLTRAPRGERQAAADAFAGEIGVSAATVWGWSLEFEVLQHLPEELIQRTPDSILRYAVSSKRTPEEAESVIADYADKPLPFRQFVETQRAKRTHTSEKEPCAECLGSGLVMCKTCGGRG